METQEVAHFPDLQTLEPSKTPDSLGFPLLQAKPPKLYQNDETMAVEALNQLSSGYSNFEKLVCGACDESFDRKSDHETHVATCTQTKGDKVHSCSSCGAGFRTKLSLQSHVAEAHQNHTRVHTCTICATQFQRPSSLSNHMKIHSYTAGRALNVDTGESAVQWIGHGYDEGVQVEDKIETIQEFAGPGDEYVTVHSLDNDKSVVKLETVRYESFEELRKASPIECGFCDKQFQDGDFLATHQQTCAKKMMQENNGKWGKHVCSDCGKKFTTKQKMHRHKWIHRKKTHTCEVCGTQFEKQAELDEHRLSAHPRDSPFTCNDCGKTFVSRQGLWEHGRVAHAETPAHFQCETCAKTFSSRQGFLIHTRTHTGERPYGCQFCWKAFRDGGTLRKHERIHTGERPHVCPLCNRAFNQKVVLREHVRWVHAASKNEPEITGPPFACPICEVPSQDENELCAHIVKHSDQMIAQTKNKAGANSQRAKATRRKPKAAKTAKNQVKEVQVPVDVSSGNVETETVEYEFHIAVDDDAATSLMVLPTEEVVGQDYEGEELDFLAVSESDGATITEKTKSIKSRKVIQIIHCEQEDSESGDEMVCGICGKDFNDKNLLMEHVKIHL